MPRDGSLWRPGAGIATLRRRGAIIAAIRGFFMARGVLEVDTPQLCPVTATDPLLESIPALPFGEDSSWYLQTSPEFAMKRLLAAGSGPIYQMAHAFRRRESGPRHNPEFTMLEWYRPGFDAAALLAEVAELVGEVIGAGPPGRAAWGARFRRRAGLARLGGRPAARGARSAARAGGAGRRWARDELLDLLFSELVEPRLGHDCLQFVDAFPASRASLARTTRDAAGNPVAERFELFIDGHEIANGYNELCDADELRRRMETDNRVRAARGLPPSPPDERLLAAMASGLPECAGVALGVDRLIMIALGVQHIGEVMAFSAERA